MPNTQTVLTRSEQHFLQSARQVIETEIASIQQLMAKLNHLFTQACQLILNTEGHVVVTGIGKSGHIGRKIAATLASTGTPAFFVHPSEANHGDLGMVTERDLLLAISNSGEANEILSLLPSLKRLGTQIISFTGNANSTLAQNATINLDISIEKEACPLGLTPTASTTNTLVLGDALAVTLLKARGFQEEDFARFHPGGALGRKLLVTVADIMHRDKRVPTVTMSASLSEALLEMTSKGLGMTAVINEEYEVLGIFTDGDLRRSLSKGLDIHTTCVDSLMTSSCTVVPPHMLAAEALKLMEQRRINALLVVDDTRKLLGVFNMHDLLNAKIL